MSQHTPNSPQARSTPASYESAAKDIESEKQMVAALKRLSIGHLVNPDPDIHASDVAYSLLLDRDALEDSSLSADTLSLSKSSSGNTSENSNSPPPRSARSPPASRPGSAHSPDRHASSSPSTPSAASAELPGDLLWVPANMHPEVNPQQFKHHVKSTIDELLERKMSRSQSASRSKRSSLSLSVTDDGSFYEETDVSPTRQKDPDVDARKRYSNPSLRDLTSELQQMSRLAGIDTNDAIALARSLSTSSLGYSDTEKLAFDELNGNSGSLNTNQAEVLDFGIEDASKNQPPAYQHPPESVGPQSPQQRSPGQSSPTRAHRGRPEDFMLKRARRVDYIKGPTTLHLGSQLQSNKAEKLAELRHNLTSAPLPGSFDGTTDQRVKHTASRSSMQSINPRSSQILFSYKGSTPQSAPRYSKKPVNKINTIGMDDLSSRDSRYSTATSPVMNIQPTKYGKSSKKAGYPESPTSPVVAQFPQQSQQHFQQQQYSPQSHHQQFSPQNQQQQFAQHRHQHQQNQHSHQHRGGTAEERSYSPYVPEHAQTKARSSSAGAHPSHRGQRRMSGAPVVPRSSSYNHSLTPQNQSQDNVNLAPQQAPKNSRSEALEENGSKYSSYMKRDKTRELSQNLEFLRSEINEFKESLAKNEPKKESPTTYKVTEPESPSETPGADFSFDLTSHEVSYDDSLGIEKDVLADVSPPPDASAEVPNTAVSETPESTAHKLPQHEFAIDDNFLADDPVAFYDASDEINPDEDLNEDTGSVKVESRDIEAAVEEHDQDHNLENAESDLSIHQTEVLADSRESQWPEGFGESTNEESEHDFDSVMEEKIRLTSEPEADVRELRKVATIATNKPDSSKRKSKKSWPWSTAKPKGQEEPEKQPAPSRSSSSPSLSVAKRNSSKEEKENVISKLFKRNRSGSTSHVTNSQVRKISVESAESDIDRRSKTSSRRSSRASEKSQHEEGTEGMESTLPQNMEKVVVEEKKVSSRIRKKIKNMKKVHDEKAEAEKEAQEAAQPEVTEEQKPMSTLEVQEKLKKTIRRSSKPNQPIEFTDSAFGFPLPPPSPSTLVMIDYRFPVHVERAIYRLSHLKLANPKRLLREQVLLSNFMYAYLNLVDHTLHLEQQMTSEEYGMEQPEGDPNLLGDQDIDTEFEPDDVYEESDFDSIKLDLDENQ